MLYSYAKLSKYDLGVVRILGVGLGNLLFPWARFVVATSKYDLKPIEPTWPQIKPGSILRGESDYRMYNNLFCVAPETIHGLKKIVILATEKRIPEFSLSAPQSKITEQYDRGIVIFEGLKNYFDDIAKEHALIRKNLLDVTRDVHKTGLSYDFSHCVSIHIRRGDFKTEGWTTPLKWFVWVMAELKKELGADVKFKIFSDGTDEELTPIISQKNTERLFFGSALADLLALSASRILVGSSHSTFSKWASYLGRMPVIWPQEGLFQKLYYECPDHEIELSQGQVLPASFVRYCKEEII